ncbi:sigma-70 family RNA polymerase sigma factor [Clostridium paraputrificum]|uniref:sigma-70 family RNA polymerase sigma factor n=1 Tax=Clostridium paraputrificum TaxID=29363 RepID=UPI003D326AD3
MNYKTIETLALHAKNGDEKAKESLIEEFKPFIFNLSSKSFIHGYELLDIQNECYKALFKALQYYDLDRHRFVAYATMAIKNSIYLLIRKSKKRSGTDGADALTMDGDLENLNLSDKSYIDDRICSACESEELNKAINSLNSDEKEFLHFITLQNKSIREYSNLKDIPYSTAVYRKGTLMRKLSRSLKENSVYLN